MSEKEVIRTAAQFADEGNVLLINGIYLRKVQANDISRCLNCQFISKGNPTICRVCIELDFRHIRERQRYMLEELPKEEFNKERRIIYKVVWRNREK